MKIKWSWNKIIRCWKVLEKSLIFRSCFLYEPCLVQVELRFSISFSHDHSYLTVVFSVSTDIEVPIERTEITDCSCEWILRFSCSVGHLISVPVPGQLSGFLNLPCELTKTQMEIYKSTNWLTQISLTCQITANPPYCLQLADFTSYLQIPLQIKIQFLSYFFSTTNIWFQSSNMTWIKIKHILIKLIWIMKGHPDLMEEKKTMAKSLVQVLSIPR